MPIASVIETDEHLKHKQTHHSSAQLMFQSTNRIYKQKHWSLSFASVVMDDENQKMKIKFGMYFKITNALSNILNRCSSTK